MNLPLKNPILIGAGPWSRDGESVQRAIDQGAAAVITETITMEVGITHRPRLYQLDGNFFNITLYSQLSIEEWEQEIKKIDRKGAFLIASIWGSTPSEMAYIARKCEGMGFDALELSVSAPLGIKSEKLLKEPDSIADYVKAVVQKVSIPVAVKLSYATSIYADAVKAIEAAGAKGISSMDTLKGIKGVDIHSKKALMPSLGGYSGSYLKPISLAICATLSSLINCDLASTGGINEARDVLEFLLMGASCVQLGSVLLREGYEVIGAILEDLEDYVQEEKLQDFSEIQGKALSSLVTYEDIPLEEGFVAQFVGVGDETLKDICIYHAIRKDQANSVDQSLCTGCGLCAEIYPELFQMVWKQKD